MSDLEQTAIERLKAASDMSLRLFEKPLVITYSGGKDSDVLLHLAKASGIPFEVLHSLTTADAPQTVYHVRDTFHRLENKGIKCTVDKHVQPDGSRITMWNLIPRKLQVPDIRAVCTDEDNLCMSTCNRKPYGFCAYRLCNDGADIGKTVFLTREEAETALEKMK